jgi:hypothetical protein
MSDGFGKRIESLSERPLPETGPRIWYCPRVELSLPFPQRAERLVRRNRRSDSAHRTPAAPAYPGTPVRFDRFSRYHTDPGAYGLELEPLSSYEFVYPLDREKLSRLVYFFVEKHDVSPETFSETLSPELLLTLRKLYEWRFLFPSSVFESGAAERKPPMLGQTRRKSGYLTIQDSRPCALAPVFELSGPEAAIYEACDSGLTRSELTALDFSEETLDRILDGLIQSRLMVKLGSHYLSLALNLPCRDYPPMDSRPGGNWIRTPASPGALSFAKAYGIAD